jgi:hypothetical protein
LSSLRIESLEHRFELTAILNPRESLTAENTPEQSEMGRAEQFQGPELQGKCDLDYGRSLKVRQCRRHST